MVWHFIEYPRQDVSGENMYVCSGTIIWIWSPIAHGFALPVGMVVKSAAELIHYLSFLRVKKKRERRILYRSEATSNSRARKRNTDISCTEMDVEDDSVNEVSVEQIDVDTQSNNVSPTLSFCDAETQTEITGEFLDRLEFELKSTGEEKDQFCKRKRRVD